MLVATCIWSTLLVYARSPIELNTLELHTPQRDSPSTCFIAQQYSSATFVSLRPHSLAEKINAHFKNAIFFFCFKNYVRLKSRSLKLRNSGSVCVEIQVPVNRGQSVCVQIHVPVNMGESVYVQIQVPVKACDSKLFVHYTAINCMQPVGNADIHDVTYSRLQLQHWVSFLVSCAFVCKYPCI